MPNRFSPQSALSREEKARVIAKEMGISEDQALQLVIAHESKSQQNGRSAPQ